MKTFKKYFWQFVCCFLIILLIFQRQCTPEPKTVNTHSVDTIHDTIHQYDTIPEHVPGQKVFDTVFSEFPFDTLDFLTDYFKIISVYDTIRGKNYEIAIHDIISRNRIQKRTASARVEVLKETIKTTDSIFYTKPTPKIRNKVYTGIGIGGWTDKAGFAPTLALNTKKDHLYAVSYDIINRTAWIQMYWKIKLKKK